MGATLHRHFWAAACLLASCTPNLAVDGDFKISCTTQDQCPEGWRCDTINNRCLQNDAPPPRCGDGIIDAGEQCDCGDEAQLVDADRCIGANSDTLPNRCRQSCEDPVCGDGTIDGTEECDDGNNLDADGCSMVCTREICGNMRIDPGEVCDDQNTDHGDGCSPDCRSDESCGNGTIDVLVGEQCDDGDILPGDGCNAACLFEYCGNKELDPGERCDDGSHCEDMTECTNDPTLCIGQPDSSCRPRGRDGCSENCASNETCRNDFVDLQVGEQCDDNNPRSNDGCSSQCGHEPLTWEREPDNPLGVGRSGTAMVYDIRRGVTVMFGGYLAEFLDDTWEFDGFRWRRPRPATRPPARRNHAMIYDPDRARVVMYGGQGVTNLGDTWEFDGADWNELMSGSSPGVLNAASMAYDPGRQRTVLFGGVDNNVYVNATWEFDGNDWMSVGTASTPLARAFAGMTYNPRDSRVVLFGGQDSSGRMNDTWEYDGSNWFQIQLPIAGCGGTATQPTCRSRMSLVYSVARDRVVMFGGYNLSGQTWEYDGTSWTQTMSMSDPPARNWYGLSYDIVRRSVVMFGGWDELNYLNDTWLYSDSAQWSEWTTTTLPPPRYRHAMAFDVGRSQAVVFGGDQPGGSMFDFTNDTWVHDADGWREMLGGGAPPDRRFHAMAYDELRGRTVLFGGQNCDNACQPGPPYRANDTWEFDGLRWQEVMVGGTLPPARTSHAMAYDPASQRVILFGGSDGATKLDDTWEFDGSSWTEITTTPRPPGRERTALAYHPGRNTVVMFGGWGITENLEDTWEYSAGGWSSVAASGPAKRLSHQLATQFTRDSVLLYGGSAGAVRYRDIWELRAGQWTELGVAGLPLPSRSGAKMVTDPRNDRLLIFGGFDAAQGGRLNQTWTLAYRSFDTPEQCTNALDDDTDGLIDCADPDCAGQIICQMPCADGTVEETFEQSMSGCAASTPAANRETLCARGIPVCNAYQWVARRGGATPANNYWIEGNLRSNGTTDDCNVFQCSGLCAIAPPVPLRVCAGPSDASGNLCSLSGCGFFYNTPDEYLGGGSDDRAGALCCP